jgi:hypothetical protein
MDAPVIIVGSHRSGTSLLTRILSEMGLFIGDVRDDNDEAWFFLELSNWMLHQAGGWWDVPEQFLQYTTGEVRQRIVEYVQYLLDSPRFAKYLEKKRYLKYQLGEDVETWGWKDPRNACTLDIWLTLFPDAKVIHIKRHGVDVAWSLHRRAIANKDSGIERFDHLMDRFGALYWLKLKEEGFGGSTRCHSLEGAFDLWTTYVEAAAETVHRHTPSLTIRYEHLLTEPRQVIPSIADFCGLTLPSSLTPTVAELDPSRACAFSRHDALVDFARGVEEELRNHEYSPDCEYV